jgi:hypothetical protein
MKLLGLVSLLVTGLLLTACDYFVSYTVSNDTDEPLRTGWFHDACSYEKELELRRGPLERVIEPGTDLKVSGVVGTEPQCVVIKSNDESIILLEKYVDGGRYIVSGSQTAGDNLRVSLAHQTTPAARHRSTSPVAYVAMAGLGLGGVIALGITVRYFYGYYFSKSHAR